MKKLLCNHSLGEPITFLSELLKIASCVLPRPHRASTPHGWIPFPKDKDSIHSELTGTKSPLLTPLKTPSSVGLPARQTKLPKV